jgi:hypothetical protein
MSPCLFSLPYLFLLPSLYTLPSLDRIRGLSSLLLLLILLFSISVKAWPMVIAICLTISALILALLGSGVAPRVIILFKN